MVSISFKTKIPKGDFDYRIFKEEFLFMLNRVNRRDIIKLFERTTEGWETKVSFKGTIQIRRGSFMKLTVFPFGDNADKYALVSEGAKPHTIRARNAPSLRFQTGYRAATRPGSLSSLGKKRFGPVIQVPSVSHPGFKGRKFDKSIADQYNPRFQETSNVALDRATRRLASAIN